METYFLVDCSPSMAQRTYSGLTKIQIARSLCVQMAESAFRHSKPIEKLFVLDSGVSACPTLETLAGFQNLPHLVNKCHAMNVCPQTSLFDSLEFILRFHRFLSSEKSPEDFCSSKMPQKAKPALVN
jgi:hypothetical protein